MSLLVRDDADDRPASRNGAARRVKADPIREALELLVGGTNELGMVEIRALGVSRHSTDRKHVESTRYCVDEQGLQQAAKDAADLSPRAEGVYWTLNPVRPNARGTAKDADIARRRWFPLDLDTKRPDRDQSSTDAERAHVFARAKVIRDYLRSEGWPDPILADSGNGYHLLYRIDLPADDTFTTQPDGSISKTDGPSSRLVRRCLLALAARFDDDQVEVDPRNYNASRIFKLYGTWACKGTDTPERPHRLAAILEVPKPLQVVGIEWLQHLAEQAPADPSPNGKPAKPKPPQPNRQGLIVRDMGSDPVEVYCSTALQAEIDRLATTPEGGRNDQLFKSAASLYQLVAAGELAAHLVEEALSTTARGLGLSDHEIHRTIQSARKAGESQPRDLSTVGKKAARKPQETPAILDPTTGLNEALDDPHRLSRGFLKTNYDHPDGTTLRWWNEEFHRWDRAWKPVSDREVNRAITTYAKREFDLHAALTQSTPITVSTRLTGNLNLALGSLVRIPLALVPEQPAWIDGDGPNPLECLPTATQIVHLPTLLEQGPDAPGAVRPATPRFFSTTVLSYSFDPNPPPPARWLRFLGELWPDDPESIRSLQQWFGYLITLETHQHKMLMMIGPKRAGKGTIARTLRALVGEANVAAPTLASLAKDFGLQQLIGKSVAIIPESRLTGRSDSQAIVERLLSISGEDPQSVERKHVVNWHGTLRSRFVLLGNELPRLGDYSGALPGRFIVLKLARSFYDKEDLGLQAALLAELPGILLWSIAGWHDLRQSGRFLQPTSGREELEELERLTNPVGAFLAEKCEVGTSFEVVTQRLYEAWVAWCKENGREHPGDLQGFARALRATVSTIGNDRRQVHGERVRYFTGLRIRFDA